MAAVLKVHAWTKCATALTVSKHRAERRRAMVRDEMMEAGIEQTDDAGFHGSRCARRRRMSSSSTRALIPADYFGNSVRICASAKSARRSKTATQVEGAALSKSRG